MDKDLYAVLLDLDGTVSDCRGRHHMIVGEDTDWDAHSLACGEDPPVEGVIALVRLLKDAGYYIAACSGRSNVARDQTEAWLVANGCPYDLLVLRAPGDRTPNGKFKVDVVEDLRRRGYVVVLAIEDYPKAARALSQHGVPTMLVAAYTGASTEEMLI